MNRAMPMGNEQHGPQFLRPFLLSDGPRPLIAPSRVKRTPHGWLGQASEGGGVHPAVFFSALDERLGGKLGPFG